MNIRLENEHGQIFISSAAIEKIAGLVAKGCVGVAQIGRKSQFGTMTSFFNKNMDKNSVKAAQKDGELQLKMSIIAKQGVNINEMSSSVIKEVKSQVGRFLGIKVKRVELTVESVYCE